MDKNRLLADTSRREWFCQPQFVKQPKFSPTWIFEHKSLRVFGWASSCCKISNEGLKSASQGLERCSLLTSLSLNFESSKGTSSPGINALLEGITSLSLVSLNLKLQHESDYQCGSDIPACMHTQAGRAHYHALFSRLPLRRISWLLRQLRCQAAEDVCQCLAQHTSIFDTPTLSQHQCQ